MANTSADISVESALGNYLAIGPEPYLGELPDGAGHWHDALNSPQVELTPAQTFTASWLGIELGFQCLTEADNIRSTFLNTPRKHRDREADDIVLGRVHSARDYMEGATNRLADLLEIEDVTLDLDIEAEVQMAFGVIPLYEAILHPGNRRMNALKQMSTYGLAQLGAVNSMHEAISAGELTDNARKFTRLLNLVVIGNSIANNDIVVLPAPPRSYVSHEDERSWHLIFWDPGRNRHLRAALSFGTTLPEVTPLLDRHVEESAILYDGIRLLEEIYRATLDPRQVVPPDTFLGKAAVNAAGYFGSLSAKRLSPKLNLPDMSKFSDRPGEPLEDSSLPVDLDPITYPEINFNAVNVDDLLDWYGQLANGRPLTPQEGLKLNSILRDYSNPVIYNRLSTAERVTLNKIRMECALAITDDFHNAALEQLKQIGRTSHVIQEQASETRDVVNLYEAAVDDLKFRVLGAAIRGEPSGLSQADIIGKLASLLRQMDFERNSLKDRNKIIRFNGLIRNVLYSLIAMRCTSDSSFVALPASDREIGSDERPGWQINLMHTSGEPGNVDVGSRLRIRIDNEVKRPMRQGDIAVVPLSVIKKTASVGEFSKSFISVSREDKRSSRSAALLDRWGDSLQPVFDKALSLIAA